MRYVEPRTLEEAVAALSREPEARCIGGGVTLVALMNAELLAPTTLVSLQRIPKLTGIEIQQDGIRIGALTTHATLAEDDRLCGSAAVVRAAAGQIAHVPIRNRGTIGGAVCHADPAGDLPAALVAANAQVEIHGPAGTRRASAERFFTGYLQTTLEPGEFVTAIFLPAEPKNARAHYLKFARSDGDYATVSVAIVLALQGIRCTYARVAVGAVGPVPLRLDAADEALVGTSLDAQVIERAGKLLAAAADPVDDVRGSSEYRRMLIPRLLTRAATFLREREVNDD